MKNAHTDSVSQESTVARLVSSVWQSRVSSDLLFDDESPGRSAALSCLVEVCWSHSDCQRGKF